MKNFVKAIDLNGRGFLRLKDKFPRIRNAIIKEVIFVGPQIREITKACLMKCLSETEIKAWKAFKAVTTSFL
jgi:hypothetical protein